MIKLGFVVPAAGRGERFGAGKNKMLVSVQGKPLLAHTLTALAAGASALIEAGIQPTAAAVAVGPGEEAEVARKVLPAVSGLDRLGAVTVVTGGATRQQSVDRGLAALPADVELVAVHDGARPLLNPRLTASVARAARDGGAAIAAVPLADTVKQLEEHPPAPDGPGSPAVSGAPAGAVPGGEFIAATPRRGLLRAAQTPQIFRRTVLEEAHRRAAAAGFTGTDDSSVVEWCGGRVQAVPGDPANIKVTSPSDLELLTFLLGGQRLQRTGFGYDVHAFSDDESRPLVLGGITIPGERGLAGHSDADVLTHAIMDALLGAAGLGDIGRHFPDNDPQYFMAKSLQLLKTVEQLLKDRDMVVSNVDATVAAERPRLQPYIDDMRASLANALDLDANAINVKATTSERLGFVGRGQGMAAYAVCHITAPAHFPR